mmetsp:Transcript_69218/g.129197  ORF Transcript_69218/g.129197 Transcript_69218/m.129197 type:complete len:124 (+) Transcript_69218:97-468(+)
MPLLRERLHLYLCPLDKFSKCVRTGAINVWQHLSWMVMTCFVIVKLVFPVMVKSWPCSYLSSFLVQARNVSRGSGYKATSAGFQRDVSVAADLKFAAHQCIVNRGQACGKKRRIDDAKVQLLP